MKKIILIINILFISFLLTGCSILLTFFTQEVNIQYSLDLEDQHYILELKFINDEGSYIAQTGNINIEIFDYTKEVSIYEKYITFNEETIFTIDKDEILKTYYSVGTLRFEINTENTKQTEEMNITQLDTLEVNSNTNVKQLGDTSLNYSSNVFNLQFELLDNELQSTNGFGQIDITIFDGTQTIYNETLSYNEFMFNQNFNIKINKELLDKTDETNGTLSLKIYSEYYQFEISLDIDNIQNNNNFKIEDIALLSSSTIGKDNIIDNNWGETKTNLEINNMLLMYEELNSIMYNFLINGGNYVVDNNVSKNDNCFVLLQTEKYSLSKDYVFEVMNAVLYDNPIYYYISKEYLYADFDKDGYNDVLYMFAYDEYSTKTTRDKYNQTIEEYFIECYKLLVNVEDDLEKSLLLHDKIVEEVDYDYSFDTHCFNILGVVAKEGPVCEAYAETYFMLLNYFDVPCYLIIGYAGEAHAWNLIQIENEWYWVDVTWNDLGNNKFNYDYFGLNNSKFMKNRTVTNKGISFENNVVYYMVELPVISNNKLDISEYRN